MDNEKLMYTKLLYYDLDQNDWVWAEENNELKQFKDREEAEMWLERNNEKAHTTGSYKIYTYLKCPYCGEEVELSRFTNTCQCGIEYNNFGQELAPREDWGWETGETAAEILDL